MATTESVGLDEILKEAGASAPFERLLAASGPVRRASAAAPGHAFAAVVLAHALGVPVLAIGHDPRVTDALAAGAAAFLGHDRVVRFPAWESLPYEGISPSPQVAGARARAAHLLRTAAGPMVVAAPVLAAIQGLAPTLGTEGPVELRRGISLPPDALAGRLVELGYVRVDVVEHRGEFAVRGGIVDLFPSTARRPVRLDYLGGEVESMREFAPATQLSTGRADLAEVYPCRELITTEDVRRRAAEAALGYRGRYAALLDRVAQGLAFEGMEQAIPLVYDRLSSLADLLPREGWVVVAQARRTADRAARILEEADALAEASGWPGPRSVRELEASLGAKQRVELSDFIEPEGVDLGIHPWERPGQREAMAHRAIELDRAGARILLAAEGRGSLDRAREVLAVDGAGGDAYVAIEADVEEGFWFRPEADGAVALALVTEEDLFGSRRHTRVAPRLARRRSEATVVELSPGDLAVHQVHGVGRYVGMVRRAVAGAERDYLLLEYAEGDKLYVPSDQVGVVAKYVGGEAPRLHRLGTNDWNRAKSRVRRAVRDMAGELVRLYSVRMTVVGHAFGPDAPWQAELEDAFPYEETRDQLAATEEVKRDMEQPRPMDRLICGDVGYGKTEIAVRAAFKSVMDGKQVAVLVPTTLLAEQHYVTFSERFAPFPVTVQMLSRFVPERDQRRVLDETERGKVDVLIGTHRLLSPDVKFHDLGLLVVDEEQR
ncbi:MAG: DEAD/DEAH box helicase, partial [Actinobacteria bacterium]